MTRKRAGSGIRMMTGNTFKVAAVAVGGLGDSSIWQTESAHYSSTPRRFSLRISLDQFPTCHMAVHSVLRRVNNGKRLLISCSWLTRRYQIHPYVIANLSSFEHCCMAVHLSIRLDHIHEPSTSLRYIDTRGRESLVV